MLVRCKLPEALQAMPHSPECRNAIGLRSLTSCILVIYPSRGAKYVTLEFPASGRSHQICMRASQMLELHNLNIYVNEKLVV